MAKDNISLVILFAVLVCVYCFVFGESGILERIGIEKKRDIVTSRIQRLQSENLLLQKSLRKYRNGEIKKEDYVRSGFVEHGGKVLYFHNNITPQPNTSGSNSDVQGSSVLIDTRHLRILWIIISSLALILFYIRTKRH